MSSFNPFTNEDADFTEPMSSDGNFEDIVSDIAFDGQTRRQFLRRLTNGLIGIGAAKNVGEIIYKTRDDKVVGGHRVEVKVQSEVENIKVSYQPDGKYKGERGHLVMPVTVQSVGVQNLDKQIELSSQCEHDMGYKYEATEFIDNLQNEKTVYPIITTKRKISEFGKPNRIQLSVFER